MKKITVLMAIGILQFSEAGSSLTQIIEADRECKSALSKDYRIASTRELECKTVHILAKKLKAHPSYRDFERIKLLKKIQDKLKIMKNSDKINWILKDVEIKKNIHKLQRLVWPIGELCYFDVELSGNQISFISAINKDGNIKLKTISEKLDSAEKGESVEICTLDSKCSGINSNNIVLKDDEYSVLKIKTVNGTINYDFKKIEIKELARIAYEVYAQLYNKNLPSLSKIDIKIEKIKPKTQNPPIETSLDERP